MRFDSKWPRGNASDENDWMCAGGAISRSVGVCPPPIIPQIDSARILRANTHCEHSLLWRKEMQESRKETIITVRLWCS